MNCSTLNASLMAHSPLRLCMLVPARTNYDLQTDQAAKPSLVGGMPPKAYRNRSAQILRSYAVRAKILGLSCLSSIQSQGR